MSLEKKVKDAWEGVSGKKLLSKGRKYLVDYIKACEYKEGEHLRNAAKFAVNFTFGYRILGSLPYKMQDSLSQEAGISRTKMTLYSAAFGICLGALKLYLGYTFEDTPIITYGTYVAKSYGYFCIAEACVRLPYTLTTNKPLGMLDFEFIYWLLPSKFRHLKQYEEEAPLMITTA